MHFVERWNGTRSLYTDLERAIERRGATNADKTRSFCCWNRDSGAIDRAGIFFFFYQARPAIPSMLKSFQIARTSQITFRSNLYPLFFFKSFGYFVGESSFSPYLFFSCPGLNFVGVNSLRSYVHIGEDLKDTLLHNGRAALREASLAN